MKIYTAVFEWPTIAWTALESSGCLECVPAVSLKSHSEFSGRNKTSAVVALRSAFLSFKDASLSSSKTSQVETRRAFGVYKVRFNNVSGCVHRRPIQHRETAIFTLRPTASQIHSPSRNNQFIYVSYDSKQALYCSSSKIITNCFSLSAFHVVVVLVVIVLVNSPEDLALQGVLAITPLDHHFFKTTLEKSLRIP